MIDKLDALVAWMRKVGAVKVHVDGMLVELGPPPAAPLPELTIESMTPEQIKAEIARKEQEFEKLLYASSEGL